MYQNNSKPPNRTDEEEQRAFEWNRITSRHCAALFVLESDGWFKQHTTDPIKSQGTITFVQYEDLVLGLTCCHVTENIDVSDPSKVFGLGLPRQAMLAPSSVIMHSNLPSAPELPEDLAIFVFKNSMKKLTDGGKAPCKLRMDKPNFTNDVEDVLLAVGFPAKERRFHAEKGQWEHRLAHIWGTCRSHTENSIWLVDDFADDERVIHFGGVSGGGIFRILDEQEMKYELVGIAWEGRGINEPDGEGKVQPNANVIGFPIWREVIDQWVEAAVKERSAIARLFDK